MSYIAFLISLLMTIGIYSISITTIDGKTVNLGAYKGKKILIVNTASASKYVNQYASLENLYQKYKDSIVVIAIPSNDFKNEPGTTSDIQTLCATKYHISYILGSMQIVTGTSISPLYKWLSQSTQNGTMDNPVIGDFCKYLIDGKGNIKGVFSGMVDPMDSVVQNAITN